ncbi:hypothetical protein ANO14919_055990 [Xylariales sp. No.14919]|nr:hypothetical protein ANO14919_055990 [Xylariales sp. No.14919]
MSVLGDHLLSSCVLLRLRPPRTSFFLYHQQQAVTRSSSSAAGAVLTMINLTWTWRELTTSSIRLLPTLVLAILTAFGLDVASIFASSVATGSEVSLIGIGCGMAVSHLSDTRLTEVFTDYTPYLANSLGQAATYASQGYEGSSSSSLGCGLFLERRGRKYGCECVIGGLVQNGNDLRTLKGKSYRRRYNVNQDRSYTQYSYGRGTDNNCAFAASNDAFYELSTTDIGPFAAGNNVG